MGTLGSIEQQVKKFSEARRALADEVGALEDEVALLRRNHLARIRRLAGMAATRHNELKALLEDAPELFVKPKTLILHGVKIGYAKARGKVNFDDEEQTLKLIHKRFEDKVDELIKVTEKPIKTALERLPASDLKKLGVTIIEATDEVVIKPTDSAIDKLVDALLKDGEQV